MYTFAFLFSTNHDFLKPHLANDSYKILMSKCNNMRCSLI